MTLEDFRASEESKARRELLALCPGWVLDLPRIVVKVRTKYILLDVEEGPSRSGRFMVDRETGTVYGILGYGKVNKRMVYGTVDLNGGQL